MDNKRHIAFVSGKIRVEPGAVPWNLLEPTVERAMDKLYQLNDGEYNISIVVLPVDTEVSAQVAIDAIKDAGQEPLWGDEGS